MTAAAFAEFLKAAPANSQDRRAVFRARLDEGLDLAAAKAKVGIKEVDEAALRVAAAAAVAANPKAVADIKKGKDAAKMSIVGAVMKANKGAPHDVVRRLVDEELAKV
jgi:aspartyl-tRNA(Asn)/glutamyl-tRNA(Gln) amidotransferase subunit B